MAIRPGGHRIGGLAACRGDPFARSCGSTKSVDKLQCSGIQDYIGSSLTVKCGRPTMQAHSMAARSGQVVATIMIPFACASGCEPLTLLRPPDGLVAMKSL